MKTTDLLRFITKNSIEYSWWQEDVIIWVPGYLVEDFIKLITGSGNFLAEGGYNATLLNGGMVGVEMKRVCEYYGVELEDVFKR